MNPTVLKIIIWCELIIFCIPAMAWPLFAFASLFVFDSPSSENNSNLVGLVWIVLGYPLLYVFSAIKTLKHLSLSNYRKSLVYASLPILAFAIFTLLSWRFFEMKCQGIFFC